MYNDKTILLVIPCYNEESGIKEVLSQKPELIDEVIVVDNDSSDNTSAVAKEMGAEVILEKNRGYGYAYKRGFQLAKGDIIVTMDGDGTYPVWEIPNLVKILEEENIDFITVRRVFTPRKIDISTMIRSIGKEVLDFTILILFFRRIDDSQSGMWVFRRNILPKLKLKSNGMPFSEEIKIEAFMCKDIKSKVIAIRYPYIMRKGKSKLKLFKDGFGNLVYLFYKRFKR